MGQNPLIWNSVLLLHLCTSERCLGQEILKEVLLLGQVLGKTVPPFLGKGTPFLEPPEHFSREINKFSLQLKRKFASPGHFRLCPVCKHKQMFQSTWIFGIFSRSGKFLSLPKIKSWSYPIWNFFKLEVLPSCLKNQQKVE